MNMDAWQPPCVFGCHSVIETKSSFLLSTCLKNKAIGKKNFMALEESDVSEVAGIDNPTKFITSDTGPFPLLSESRHKVKIGNYEFLAATDDHEEEMKTTVGLTFSAENGGCKKQ
ncbi:hypothetical protein NC653_021504 [Populus alba x Populus x berolinensis]|uniref:Uncharacterized protein n=1 Tax=Populus alba x Populus x berolinensis TaxID=444605 RepID=A0AAD6MPV7_9ROSI|nr:hypothetical protein NC653_021504 [Populus alba x Populus x berolinensis]